jgi:hypothetical protein
MHKTTNRFWECYEKLPVSVQRLAKKNFDILKVKPQHPSLHFKKVGKLWSVRVGINYRALAVEENNDFVWVWIGTHDEYDKLLN